MEAAHPPVVTSVNYQLQPVVIFNGNNWSIFHAAFTNYARQQGFYTMLGDDGVQEPDGDGADRWRQRMAQATTALTSGWVSQNILSLFRYSNDENANSIWRKLNKHYGNITDIRQMSLRDRAERLKQKNDESLMDWLGNLNSRVADLAASGHECDDTYRKQLVRHNCNQRYHPLVQQILLVNPQQTYEDFSMALLETAADNEELFRNGDRAYFSSNNRGRNGGRHRHQSGGRFNSGRFEHQHSNAGRNRSSGIRNNNSRGNARRGNSQRGNNNNRSRETCHTCGGRGHFSRDCANNQRRNHRAHNAQEQVFNQQSNSHLQHLLILSVQTLIKQLDCNGSVS